VIRIRLGFNGSGSTNDPTKSKKERASSFGLDFSIYGGFRLLLEFDVLFNGNLSTRKFWFVSGVSQKPGSGSGHKLVVPTGHGMQFLVRRENSVFLIRNIIDMAENLIPTYMLNFILKLCVRRLTF
jgi:hypothetical protein